MSLNAQGTTITFGSTIARVKPIRTKDSSDKLDITNLSSTGKEYETGFTDREITLEVFGITSIVNGDTGQLTINWSDGSSAYGPYDVIVLNVERGADVSTPLSSTITFSKTSA